MKDNETIAREWLHTSEGLQVLLAEYDKGYEAGVSDDKQAIRDAYDDGWSAGFDRGESAARSIE